MKSIPIPSLVFPFFKPIGTPRRLPPPLLQLSNINQISFVNYEVPLPRDHLLLFPRVRPAVTLVAPLKTPQHTIVDMLERHQTKSRHKRLPALPGWPRPRAWWRFARLVFDLLASPFALTTRMNGMSGLQGMGMNSMSGFGSALAKAPIPWPSKTVPSKS
uniref:Uncharacterized protein n=1 Tax=Fusarium oxysporum (strain Fo5176) TaxID=660025 RepID=A0A0D2YDV9_FUSOF